MTITGHFWVVYKAGSPLPSDLVSLEHNRQKPSPGTFSIPILKPEKLRSQEASGNQVCLSGARR